MLYTYYSTHRLSLPTSYSLLFLFFLSLSAIAVIVVAFKCGLELISSGAVSCDEIGELLDVLVLILHGALIQRERPDELLNGQRPDALLLETIGGQNFLTRRAQRAC